MCLQIEAEKVPDLTAHLKISSVPTTVFLTKGNVVDRVEGFQPSTLFEKADANKPVDLQARLKQLTASQPVMLFMKGSPDAPRCGFSKKVVAALQQDGITFGSFDILSDEEVRYKLPLTIFARNLHSVYRMPSQSSGAVCSCSLGCPPAAMQQIIQVRQGLKEYSCLLYTSPSPRD